jgi:ATP-dependent RNA helicase DOB1
MDYVGSFKMSMVDLTLAWCKGASFAEICKISSLFEGSIIRCLRRLDELLK